LAKKLIGIINYILFAAIGVVLLFLSFRKVHFSDLLTILNSGNYSTVFPVLVVTILVYIMRVSRWSILLKSLDIKVPRISLFAALFIGYFVNYAIPRLGEISRSLALKRSDDVMLSQSLSTVAFERMVDMFCLFLIVIITLVMDLISDHGIINTFLDFEYKTSQLLLVASMCLVVLTGIFLFVRRKFKQLIIKWFAVFWASFKKLFILKGMLNFFILTIMIWLGYYLMTFLWFSTFKETANLGIYTAFILLSVGTVARSLPIQAGSAGAYHFAFSSAIALFGISITTGNALAIIIHGFQTLVTFALGLISVAWLLLKERGFFKKL